MKEHLAGLDDDVELSSVVSEFVSPSDPAAQWTSAQGDLHSSRTLTNYLIDVKFGVILVDVEASRTIRQAKGQQQKPSNRPKSAGLKNGRLVEYRLQGEASAGTGLSKKDIMPVPVLSKSSGMMAHLSRSNTV